MKSKYMLIILFLAIAIFFCGAATATNSTTDIQQNLQTNIQPSSGIQDMDSSTSKITQTSEQQSNNQQSKTLSALNQESNAVNSGLSTTSTGPVYVSTTGSDITGNGNKTNPYRTISTGINMVNSGGTVYLANGNYKGTGNYAININKNLNIIGQSQIGTVIDAQRLGRIFNILPGYTVTLQNLKLKYGNATYGGAIYNSATLYVTNCTFINNTANPELTQFGGAIYNSGKLVLNYSTFLNNTSVHPLIYNIRYFANGGVIDNEGTLTMNHCTFTNNTAMDSGGAIYNKGTLNINDSSFKGNKGGSGGVIYSEGNLVIKRSTFTNSISNSRGGAIDNELGTLNIQYSSFIKGVSQLGTIYNAGNLNITGCNFTNNTAISNLATFKGGAIYNSAGICNITKCNFTSNAADMGGSIYNGAKCNISSSNFVTNSATGTGGAIDNDGTCTISNSKFKTNSAVHYGGAISNFSIVNNINNCNFTSNNANRGGAIYNNLVIWDIMNCNFTSNFDNTSGGAIYNAQSIVNITNSAFTSNSALNQGGAIYNYLDAPILTKCNFTENSANYGGAIYGGSSINYSKFTNNKAYNGGAIYNPYNIVDVKYSNFIGNSATNLGGAFFITGQGTILKVTGCKLIKNVANVGSAIYTRAILDYTLGFLVIAHFNYLYGNIGSYDIYSVITNYTDARYNWWGTNFPGSNPITAKRINGYNTYTCSPWLVLKLTVTPTSINKNSASTVTASLLYDSNGTYHDPSGGHVPDEIPITFKTNTAYGSINSSVNTVNGKATATFKSNYTSGKATVTAVLNNQTVSKTITIF